MAGEPPVTGRADRLGYFPDPPAPPRRGRWAEQQRDRERDRAWLDELTRRRGLEAWLLARRGERET